MNIHSHCNHIQVKIENIVFMAALFTKSKTWKQPKGPTEERIKKRCTSNIHKGILLSHTKEWKKNTICSNMDGPEIITVK